jgi:undecaprenyl phosphate N,N'-diacetylbacillosamine 1-phosphate transferase
VRARDRQGFYASRAKRAFDLVVALLGLLVVAPLIALLCLLVRWRLGAPVFFRQARPGLHERPFVLVKFRTMTDARTPDGRLLPDAERLPPFGRFLRKTSADELPELWNVLKGNMSLVGPRPLLPEYLPWYTPRESLRHSVRPGLTGLAQVSGRNLLGWDERLECDAVYVEKLSLGLDLWILWRTATTVLAPSTVAVDTAQAEGNLARMRAGRVTECTDAAVRKLPGGPTPADGMGRNAR